MKTWTFKIIIKSNNNKKFNDKLTLVPPHLRTKPMFESHFLKILFLNLFLTTHSFNFLATHSPKNHYYKIHFYKKIGAKKTSARYLSNEQIIQKKITFFNIYIHEDFDK